MKERPIIFQPESVRAILGGRKTQTRRVVKYEVRGPHPPPVTWHFYKNGIFMGVYSSGMERSGALALCPFGKPGDRLWVREPWGMGAHGPLYKEADSGDGTVFMAWKSPIFMPRRFSRVVLEIAAVRVERIQDLSKKDAVAEGVARHIVRPGKRSSFQDAFAVHWNSINGKKHPWSSNPWVWVTEFTVAL